MNEQSPDLKYYAYSWAIVGLNDIESSIPIASLDKGNGLEKGIEQYVIGYLNFWNITKIDKTNISVKAKPNDTIFEVGIMKIADYIAQFEQVEQLPKFYIIFLNQPHIGCDANGFSNVFCF
jgi:hypothetical protein